ncbi:MAG: hypothetical protein HOW73_14160 [Polyangiaceae bacterium]|nr:hypothetical protein [Polyangiaceae bacterium]
MKWSVFSILPLLVTMVGGPSFAQPGSPKDSARVMAERGQSLLQAGKPAEALVELRRAEATFHAPTIVFLIARANVEIGAVDQAYADYTRVIEEKLPAGAPPEWREAQRLAWEERAALAPKVRASTIARAGSTEDRGIEWLAGGLVGIGVGLAGVGFGIGEGIDAMNRKADIEDAGACRDGMCLPSAKSDVDDATLAAHLSTAGFVVGGVALAAGGTLLGVYLAGQSGSARVRAAGGPFGAHITLELTF